MAVRQLKLGPMENFVYLLFDPASKECAVVDPGWDAEAVLAAVRKDGLRVSKILLTHNHFDHVDAVVDLLSHVDVPVYIHESDAPALKALGGRLRPTRDGDKLRLGATAIECLHTPGHTPGSQCFLFGDRLATGDTLFVGACGRVDLPGSDPGKMRESLRRLAALPGETIILPGHDYGRTPTASISSERRTNRFLKGCAGRPSSA